MLGEALQLGLELDNQLHGGAHIDVVVVGLGCGLEASQDGPAVRVRAMDDDYLSPVEQIMERLNKSISHILGPRPWKTYLCVGKVAEHLQPDIGLVVIRGHRPQEGDVDVLVGEGRVPRGYANDGN